MAVHEKKLKFHNFDEYQRRDIYFLLINLIIKS